MQAIRGIWLALLIGVLTGVALSDSVLAESPTFKVGSLLILSGEGASWGTASKNGIDLAVEDLNARGGVLGRKIEVLHQDDRGDAKQTIAAYRNLVDSAGVKFIFGPSWSDLGLPLIPLADQNRTLLISPTLGMGKFNESSKYCFTIWPHDALLSEKLAELVFQRGHHSVAVVGTQNNWVKEQTDAFSKKFIELGGRVPLTIEPLPDAVDLRSEALQILKRKDIQAVVSTTDGVIVGSLVAKHYKTLNGKLPWFSVSLDQAAIDAADGGFEGLVYLTSLTPRESYRERYENRFKTPIEIGGDSGYDSVMLLAQAVTTANSFEPEAVAAAFAAIKEFDGQSGHLVSDGRRGFTKTYIEQTVSSSRPRASRITER